MEHRLLSPRPLSPTQPLSPLRCLPPFRLDPYFSPASFSSSCTPRTPRTDMCVHYMSQSPCMVIPPFHHHIFFCRSTTRGGQFLLNIAFESCYLARQLAKPINAASREQSMYVMRLAWVSTYRLHDVRDGIAVILLAGIYHCAMTAIGTE